jgi:hypothetical protein
MGTMATLSRAGDVRVMWNPDVPGEVAAAKKAFDEAIKKGMLAFSVKKTGEKGTQVREFDAEAEKIILAPPMRGGSR